MIVTCPSCSTRYTLRPETLGEKGRRVRCSSCDHRWFATAEPPEQPADAGEAAPLPPPPPEEAPRPARAARPARKPAPHGRLPVAAAWLLVVLIAGGLIVFVAGRDAIVAGLPGTASLYQRLGLSVTRDLGLELRDLVAERLDDGEGGGLVIAGRVENVSRGDRDVPPLRITLLDDARAVLEHHLAEAEGAELAPGESTRFEARLAALPEAARNYSVTFAVEE